MRFDRTLKELLHKLPERLFVMLTGSRVAAQISVQLPSVRMREPDMVVRLQDGRIFHLEIQSDNDPTMSWRMLDYYSPLRQRYPDSEIVQMVLYVGREPLVMQPEIRDEPLQFRYSLVDARTLDGEELLASRSIEDNLLAVLCNTTDKL